MDLYTLPFLLVLLQVCIAKSSGSQPSPQNSSIRQQVLKLHKVAQIRKKILSRIGISDPPNSSGHRSKPIAKQDTDHQKTVYKIPGVISYHSEPPDNFSDENIVQFSLFNKIYGKPIKVENVNLLVRVKLRKPRTNNKSKRDIVTKKRKKQRRKKKFKEVDIIISNVTSNGAPDTILTSIKTKLRKTRSFRLSIPKDIIQNVLDSNKNRLQFFIQCVGCDKKAKLILVQKKRRRKSLDKNAAVGSTRVKLRKRRPMLFILSHFTNGSYI